ncbi:MAG: septum formation inhibitor Maf [Clostridia bacterium]|nr:septum formation inhibitor Maf [Clostridia bacterium]
MEIILASGSPRRKELLHTLGLDFTVRESHADETVDQALPPYFICEQLSLLKASSVAAELKSEGTDAIVIGADTIVVTDGAIVTKPTDTQDAKNILSSLSGNWHSVFTGVTVMNTKNAKSETFYVETKVHFIKLNDADIDAYIKTGEPMDKAGAYGIQGKGAQLIDRIEGDYFNVVGLPICKLAQVLKEEFGIACL